MHVPYDMIFSTVITLLLLVLRVNSYKSYRGYKLFDYRVNSTEAERVISNIEEVFPLVAVDIWKHASLNEDGVMLVAPSVIGKITHYLQRNGIRLRTRFTNVQRLIRQQRKQNNYQRISSMYFRTQRRKHSYYMRYNEILQWLRNKAAACRSPLVCSTEVIGKTVFNRNLVLIKISTGANKEKVWIDAGIHAREWIAPATAIYLIDKLLEYDNDARLLLERFDFYILPLMNPDGYEYTHTHTRFWRKNLVSSPRSACFGVDLNRNWGYEWGGRGASALPCMENFRGRKPFSELETACVSKYLKSIRRDVRLFITLHSFGQFILTPFSHKKSTYPANIQKLRDMGHRVAQRLEAFSGRFYDVGSAADLLYEAAGGSDDYVSAVLHIPYTFTIELPDEGRYGFLLPPQYILQVGREMWVALKEFVDNV